MNEARLDAGYWTFALDYAVWIRNRTVTAAKTNANSNKTPWERLTNWKPSWNHIRVFGCICYSYIDKSLRKKLDDIRDTCIFLGFGRGTHTYKMMKIDNYELIERSFNDVEFNEELTCHDVGHSRSHSRSHSFIRTAPDKTHLQFPLHFDINHQDYEDEPLQEPNPVINDDNDEVAVGENECENPVVNDDDEMQSQIFPQQQNQHDQ